MRRHSLIRGFAVIGPILVAISILWEFARMNPGYGSLVAPWSIRGYETVHGAIYATVGVALLVLAVLVGREASQRIPVGIGIIALTVVAATVIGAAFIEDDINLTPNVFVGFVIALLVTLVLSRALRDEFGERWTFLKSGGGRVAANVVILVATYFILGATVIGNEISLSPAVAIGAVFVLLAALALSGRPRELAANRMLVTTSLVAWGALAFQAGAIRSTLVRAQAEFNGEAFGFDMTGVVAQYKDTQITSGWFIMNFGMLLLFIGAVALWAKRRDHILALQRARQQREAAEKSAAEIREALEKLGLLRE